DFDETKLLHDAPGVLAIETVAAHHPHVKITAPVHGGNHAVVPEGIHARPLGEALWRTFLPRNAKADGWPQNANGQVSSPGNQPQLDAFFQSEFAPRFVSPR